MENETPRVVIAVAHKSVLIRNKNIRVRNVGVRCSANMETGRGIVETVEAWLFVNTIGADISVVSATEQLSVNMEQRGLVAVYVEAETYAFTRSEEIGVASVAEAAYVFMATEKISVASARRSNKA